MVMPCPGRKVASWTGLGGVGFSCSGEVFIQLQIVRNKRLIRSERSSEFFFNDLSGIAIVTFYFDVFLLGTIFKGNGEFTGRYF